MTSSSNNFRRRQWLCGALLVGLVAVAPATAQRMRIGSSNPTGTAAGTTFPDALFAAGDTKVGVELWYSKGTTASTGRLIDVYPGPFSSYPTEITRRSPSNGNTWFVARAKPGRTEFGRELHYYPNLPGSTAGGWVKDIVAGAGSSHPSQLTLVGNRLFFTAIDKAGRELWTSDGTLGGTVRLKDILPGAASSNPFGLTVYGKRLIFAATTKVGGTELWVSAGTAASTVQLKDIRLGSGSSTPSKFTLFRGKLYFAATTNRPGRELWCTDGTTAGTVQVADVLPGSASSAPSQLRSGAGGLAFTAWTPKLGRQLHIFDGTKVTLKTKLARGESIGALTAAGNDFWFRAHTAAAGQELWRCNAAGVGLVHNMRVGSAPSFPSNITPFGKGVIFRCNNGLLGDEYWRTDGTTATLVQDIRPGPCASRPAKLVPISVSGRTLYLFGAKGNKNGIEFWRTTGAGAALVRDIDPANVLPGLHWDSSPAGIQIAVKDASPNQRGILIIATGVIRPLGFNFLRGLISVNLFGPTVLLPFNTDRLGEWDLRIPPLPITQRATSIVSQALVNSTAGFLEASVPGSCNQGVLDLNPPNGPKVEGRICLDDESGEYLFCARRTDNNPAPAYIGIYQKGPGGDLEFMMSCPINAGEFIEESGQIEILLPLDPDDLPGRHMEMHLFYDEPGPGSESPASLVTTSYC